MNMFLKFIGTLEIIIYNQAKISEQFLALVTHQPTLVNLC